MMMMIMCIVHINNNNNNGNVKLYIYIVFYFECPFPRSKLVTYIERGLTEVERVHRIVASGRC